MREKWDSEESDTEKRGEKRFALPFGFFEVKKALWKGLISSLFWFLTVGLVQWERRAKPIFNPTRKKGWWTVDNSHAPKGFSYSAVGGVLSDSTSLCTELLFFTFPFFFNRCLIQLEQMGQISADEWQGEFHFYCKWNLIIGQPSVFFNGQNPMVRIVLDCGHSYCDNGNKNFLDESKPHLTVEQLKVASCWVSYLTMEMLSLSLLPRSCPNFPENSSFLAVYTKLLRLWTCFANW